MVQGTVFFGANLEDAKDHNRRVVLEAVRVHGEISRADITRLTRLSTQTVSNIAEEFLDRALFREAASKPVARGKPPRMLSINADGAYSIGLQLDHQGLLGVLLDFSGRVRANLRVELSTPTPADGFPALRSAVNSLIDKAGIGSNTVCGVGVVMPGPFNVNDISASGPTVLPQWEHFPLVERLNASTGLPVYLENDATAAAMGEYYFGVVRSLRNFACIFIGTGLGGGLVIEGQPYRGIKGNAGEIGHLPLYADGRPCYCGNVGCAERYLSLHSAYDRLGLRHAAGSQTELLRLCETGDQGFEQWIDDATKAFRLLVTHIENMLDPETIVVTGYMPQRIIDRILSAISGDLPQTVSAYARGGTPRLIVGSVGLEAAALGAAVFPLFHSFGHVTPARNGRAGQL